ncbi:MAG: hypothetical protein AB1644_02760 [Candidatus Zixiibacteriota bacterium]
MTKLVIVKVPTFEKGSDGFTTYIDSGINFGIFMATSALEIQTDPIPKVDGG